MGEAPVHQEGVADPPLGTDIRSFYRPVYWLQYEGTHKAVAIYLLKKADDKR